MNIPHGNDHRSALLAIVARLDQMQSDAEAVLAGGELIVEMQALVEEKLDQ